MAADLANAHSDSDTVPHLNLYSKPNASTKPHRYPSGSAGIILNLRGDPLAKCCNRGNYPYIDLNCGCESTS